MVHASCWPARRSGCNSGVRTHSPLFYLHWQLAAGAECSCPAAYSERAAYVAGGFGFGRGAALRRWPDAGVLEPALTRRSTADADTVVMGLGGEPVGERFIEWNFVSSSKEADRAGESGLACGADETA